MQWSEIRKNHPKKWAVIEVKESHEIDDVCYIDKFAVIDFCDDYFESLDCIKEMRNCSSGFLTPFSTEEPELKMSIIRNAFVG